MKNDDVLLHLIILNADKVEKICSFFNVL